MTDNESTIHGGFSTAITTGDTMSGKNRTPLASIALCASLAAASVAVGNAQASTLTIDVAGIESREETPSAGNESFSYLIGAGASVVSVTYDVTLQANAPSWLSEMGVAITDSSGTAGIQLFPGFGSNNAGTQRFTGTVLLADPLNVTAGSDGVLRLEFFELAADGLTPDGVWLSGALTLVAVPEPATYAMLLAGIAAFSIARRSTGRRLPR